MKDYNAKRLRALVEADQKLSDGERTDLLADLRAEAFWNERAPLLNEELLALRPLEKFVRVLLSAKIVDEMKGPDGKELVASLDRLDAVRAEQAKRLKAA